jgi:hypothetical protein
MCSGFRSCSCSGSSWSSRSWPCSCLCSWHGRLLGLLARQRTMVPGTQAAQGRGCSWRGVEEEGRGLPTCSWCWCSSGVQGSGAPVYERGPTMTWRPARDCPHPARPRYEGSTGQGPLAHRLGVGEDTRKGASFSSKSKLLWMELHTVIPSRRFPTPLGLCLHLGCWVAPNCAGARWTTVCAAGVYLLTLLTLHHLPFRDCSRSLLIRDRPPGYPSKARSAPLLGLCF